MQRFWENQTTNPYQVCQQCWCPMSNLHYPHCPLIAHLFEKPVESQAKEGM